jgi:hypothetical protein
MPTPDFDAPGYEYRTGRRPVIFDLMPRAAELINLLAEGPPDELLPRTRVATWLDIGESALQGLASVGLKQVAVGRRFYRRGDVVAFLRHLADAYERHLKDQIASAVATKAEAERSLAAMAKARRPQRRAAA